jgi:hypothetical protein
MSDRLIIHEFFRAVSRSFAHPRRPSAVAICGGKSESCPNVRQTAYFAVFSPFEWSVFARRSCLKIGGDI